MNNGSGGGARRRRSGAECSTRVVYVEYGYLERVLELDNERVSNRAQNALLIQRVLHLL